MVSKLSVKSGGVSPKKVHALADGQTTLKLCTIKGIASGIKTVEDPVHGRTFFPLVGMFQATNAQTGDVTRSGVLYLPGGIHESYESRVRNLEDGDTLQFHVEIRAVKADNPAGYSYEAVDLMPPSEVDPLDMVGRLQAPKVETAKLEAPKVEPTQPKHVEAHKATAKK